MTANSAKKKKNQYKREWYQRNREYADAYTSAYYAETRDADRSGEPWVLADFYTLLRGWNHPTREVAEALGRSQQAVIVYKSMIRSGRKRVPGCLLWKIESILRAERTADGESPSRARA